MTTTKEVIEGLREKIKELKKLEKLYPDVEWGDEHHDEINIYQSAIEKLLLLEDREEKCLHEYTKTCCNGFIRGHTGPCSWYCKYCGKNSVIPDVIINSSPKEEKECEIKEEDIELLKRIRGYLPNNSGVGTSTLLYVPPAQAMRNAADRIEQQERDERLFNELIETLTSYITKR